MLSALRLEAGRQAGRQAGEHTSSRPPSAHSHSPMCHCAALALAGVSLQGPPSMRQLAVAALREIWPALSALALSCTISLVLFPFFTYVPTSGLLGESLPKVGGS